MKTTHIEQVKEMDSNYRIFLKNPKLYLDETTCYNFINDFKTLLYDIIYRQLSKYSELNERYIRYYCNYIKKNILPFAQKKLASVKKKLDNEKELTELEKDNENYQRWVALEDDLYAMVSYRDIKYYAYYLERAKRPNRRVWEKTMNIFESFFHYANEMVLNDNVDKIRASFMPSMGKTYAGNIVCAYWISYDPEMSIIRITYSDDLAKKFTKQISGILKSKQHKKVFPHFDKEKKDLFAEDSAYCIKLKGSEENNFNAMTRYGQVTGKRGRLLMTDDLLKGKTEAGNFKIQDEIVGIYDSDWTSRADGEDQKELHLGTMWSNHDLLNIIKKRDSEVTNFVKDEKYKYTELCYNGRGVYIGVPALDYDTDESTCPLRYSTQFLRRKRETIDPFIWNAEYQQTPAEPASLPFSYSRLKTYDEHTYPEPILNGNYQCRVAIDPNRRGIDYFVCLIFKRYRMKPSNEWSCWYFADCLCKKDIYKNVKNELINKLVKNRVDRIALEINTSNELPDLISEDLAKAKYFNFDISPIFSTENKEAKIGMAQYDIRDKIIFPKKGMFAQSSEMGIAMEMITTYSFDRKAEHDDCPDCLAIFSNDNETAELTNTIEVVSRI